MSKLDYSGDADNGGSGWQEENLVDDLINAEPIVSQQPESVAIEEVDIAALSLNSGSFETQQQHPLQDSLPLSMSNYGGETSNTIESIGISNVENKAPSILEHVTPITESPSANQEQEVNNYNLKTVESLPEPSIIPPTQEEIIPPPSLLMPPSEPTATSFSPPKLMPELTPAIPLMAESQVFTAPPPQLQPQFQPDKPSVMTSPRQTIPIPQAPKGDLTKVPTATFRSAALPGAVSAAPTSLPSQTGTEQTNFGTRKPLTFPQSNISYKQPMDYTALLSNAAARTTASTARAGAVVSNVVKQPVQPPVAATMNSQMLTANQQVKIAAAPVVAQQQQRQPYIAGYGSKVSTGQNIMSYPSQPLTNVVKNDATALPVLAKPVVEQPPPVQVTQPQQLRLSQPVANVNFPKSQTMPEIGDITSQQQYQSFNSSHNDSYSANEQDGVPKPARTSGTGTSEKRTRRHHHHGGRHSNKFHQPPPADQYHMGYFTENPQYYADYYRQWYEQQARMYGSLSGASTPANYGESDSEYDAGLSQSRPSSRMSVGPYASPQVNNPYFQNMQQFQGGAYDPATAAWWYYMQYYMQQQSQPVQPQRPSTPKKFVYPHCRATFSSSGFLVVVLPGRNAFAGSGSPATRVNVMRTFDAVSPAMPELKEYSSFPGPLLPNESHKVDVIGFAQQMSQQALSSDYIDRDSVSLLWRFIALLVRQNGTYFGADVAQLLTEMIPALPEQLVEPADQAIQAPAGSVQQLREFLLHGRKREAVEFAMSRNLWAHAMFLSHSVSEQYFLAVRNRFLAASAAPGDPLATFYQLATLSSPVISRQAVTSDMNSWRQHLAVILSNAAASPQFQRQLLLSLGDILRSQGRLYAAQFCYLMAGDQFSAFPPASSDGFSTSTRLILLGSEPCPDFLRLAKPYFCQLTEIYEYCLRLANPRAVLPTFQLFKAFYCLCLAEVGLVHESFRYLVSLFESLQISFNLYPALANSFPKICFKWLYDLYIALHKSEPAIDYSTVEWIANAAKGGPIQPPPLPQSQVMNAPQQQQNYYQVRQDDVRYMNQTPGPLYSGQAVPSSFPQPPQPHYTQSVTASSLQPTQQPQQQPQPIQEPPPLPQQQVLPQTFQQPQSTLAPSSSQPQNDNLPFAKSIGGSMLPGGQPNLPDHMRPFARSGHFGASMSRRSDGGSDQPGFGSSMESLTSINNMMADMRKTAMNYASEESHREQVHQQQLPPPPDTMSLHSTVESTIGSQQQPLTKYPPPEDNNRPPLDQQPYVSPLSTWQPQFVSSAGPPGVQSQPPVSRPQPEMTRDVAPTPPLSSQSDKSPKKHDESDNKDTPSGGWFTSLTSMRNKLVGTGGSNSKPGPKRMILPDDSKPALVWDKDRNRWVDTSKADGDDAAEDIPPPPPPMVPPSQPLMGMPQTMPAPNLSMQRPRGRYVDLFKPADATTNGPPTLPGASNLLRPPLYGTQQAARMFVPPPVAPDSS